MTTKQPKCTCKPCKCYTDDFHHPPRTLETLLKHAQKFYDEDRQVITIGFNKESGRLTTYTRTDNAYESIVLLDKAKLSIHALCCMFTDNNGIKSAR